MLKKLKSVLLAIVLILPLMVVFSGCKGDEGNNNQNNNQQTEQPTNPDPPTPVDGTYNLKLDYALPGRLSELYDNIDETKSTKTSFVLPSFTGTNLNDFFDGWYDRSNDTKIEKSWVLGTNGQTISVYGKWNEEILDYYYSDGLEISVNISSNYAYVSGYNDSSETIVLPKIFSYEDNDFLVNVISQNAFENSSVKKVIYLGDELEIEDEAF